MSDWTVCSCGMNLPPGRKCPICEEQGEFKTAGLVVDDYRVERFEKELRKDNFLYEVVGHLTATTTAIKVWTNNAPKLKKTVERAMRKSNKKGL